MVGDYDDLLKKDVGFLDYKYCSLCGQRLNASARFCNNCGGRVEPQMVERVEFPAYQEPKHRDELEEYLWIYTNSERYIEKWRKNSKWNWPAFLFGPFWMGYRKMYAESAMYLIVISLISIIQILMDTPNSFYGIYSAVYVVVAMNANKIYYRKAKKSIESIMLLYGEQEVRYSLVRKKGGTSGWGIVYAIIIALILVFIEDAIPPSVTSAPAVSKTITFAEDLDKDSDRLTAIDPDTVFKRGEIAVILDNGSSKIAVDTLTFTVMKTIDGSEQIVERFDNVVDPKWVTCGIMYSFTEKGQYRVTIEKPSGELIGDGRVDIK